MTGRDRVDLHASLVGDGLADVPVSPSSLHDVNDPIPFRSAGGSTVEIESFLHLPDLPLALIDVDPAGGARKTSALVAPTASRRSR